MANFDKLFIITKNEMEGNGFQSFFEKSKPEYKVSLELPSPDFFERKVTSQTLVLLDTDSFDNSLLINFLNDLTKYEISCIIFSHSSGPGLLIKAKQLGINGYVSKASSLQKLLDCIKVIELGGLYYDSCFSAALKKLSAFEQMLSITERNILYDVLLFPNRPIREIAQSLNFSKHTLEVHLSNLYKKLCVHSYGEFIKYFQYEND